MKDIEARQVALLSPPVNFAVVQLPERAFPGVVLQGDTLRAINGQVERMQELLNAGELEELTDEIVDLRAQLSAALSYFEQICADRGVALPY